MISVWLLTLRRIDCEVDTDLRTSKRLNLTGLFIMRISTFEFAAHLAQRRLNVIAVSVVKHTGSKNNNDSSAVYMTLGSFLTRQGLHLV